MTNCHIVGTKSITVVKASLYTQPTQFGQKLLVPECLLPILIEPLSYLVRSSFSQWRIPLIDPTYLYVRVHFLAETCPPAVGDHMNGHGNTNNHTDEANSLHGKMELVFGASSKSLLQHVDQAESHVHKAVADAWHHQSTEHERANQVIAFSH